MTPSLPPLPVVSGGSGNHPDVSVNIQSNRVDNGLSGEFHQLLDQAYDAAPGTVAAEPVAELRDRDLLVQLQSLPEDGKLLPLLQQLIDSTAARGADPRQVLEKILARLERSGTDNGRDAADGIQQALQQLINGGAQQVAAMPTDTTALAAASPNVTLAQGAAPDAAGRRLPQVAAQLRLADGSAAEHGKLPAEGGREQQGAGVTKSLEPLYQPAAETGQRSIEALAALAGLKHQGDGLKSAAQVTTAGPEPMTAVMSHTAPQAGGAAGASAGPTVSVEVPVQQANWDQALGERIQWLMGQRLQGAQIKLNPAHLGPMEVRIQVQHDQTSIQFTSAHAMVREALEAALPRLRDMFESAGIELLNVDVSGQSLAHQHSASDGREAAPGWQRFASGRDAGVETVLETAVDRLVISGRLDLFA